MTAVEPLTALDAVFLYAERFGAPLHVGAVATLEAGPLLDAGGELRIDDIRRLVEARLALLPRLRRRLVWPLAGFARPCWIDDDTFDISRHVDVAALPRGSGDDELRAVAEELFAVPLDRDRPLWHVRLVTGLSGGRIGLVERVHHALVDGVSGVDVAAALFDVSADPAPIAAPPAVERRGTGVSIGLAEARAELATPLAVLRGAAGAARHPSRVVAQANEVVRGLRATLDAGRAPASSLNVSIGDERRLAWVRTSLDAVRSVGRDHGVTVNDVVLTAVAGGLRALLAGRGEAVGDGDELRVLVPMSLRSADSRGTLGNRVTGLTVALPIGIADPFERLAAVHAATAATKASGEAAATGAVLAALDLVPAPLLGASRPLVDHQPLVNLVVTNVPGSPVALHLLGARMLEALPFVPVAGNLSLGVAVLSYDGTLALGITADADTCPDVHTFADGVERGFADLGVRRVAMIGA